MGSLVDRSLEQAAFAAAPALVAILLLLRLRRPLDSLTLGEEVAQSFGHDVRRLRIEIVCLTAFGVGACVAICGAIGFVGLVAPIFARRLTGGHPGRAIAPGGPDRRPASARRGPRGAKRAARPDPADRGRHRLARRALLPLAGRATCAGGWRDDCAARGQRRRARGPARTDRFRRREAGAGLPGRAQWQRQDQPAPRARPDRRADGRGADRRAASGRPGPGRRGGGSSPSCPPRATSPGRSRRATWSGSGRARPRPTQRWPRSI